MRLSHLFLKNKLLMGSSLRVWSAPAADSAPAVGMTLCLFPASASPGRRLAQPGHRPRAAVSSHRPSLLLTGCLRLLLGSEVLKLNHFLGVITSAN